MVAVVGMGNRQHPTSVPQILEMLLLLMVVVELAVAVGVRFYFP